MAASSGGGSDAELLERWRAGETAAGELLFNRHFSAVRRFFRNKVPAGVAHDLSQDTFLACLEACARSQPHHTFRGYLLGIARHRMIDYLRARRGGDELDLEQVVLADLAPGGDDAFAAKRERRLLLHALRRLRMPLQVVLELRYWEAMSDREIAEILEEPLGTVKSRLRTGLEALEVELARLAGNPDELRSTLDSLQHWANRVRPAPPDVPPDAPPLHGDAAALGIPPR